jgi:hypothetical protein
MMEEENSAGLDRAAEMGALRKKIAALPLRVLLAMGVLFACWLTVLIVEYKFGVGITFIIACIWAGVTLIDYKMSRDD